MGQQILLGHNEQPVRLDLSKLIDTKMLITANSGGGKSWALRRLIEQAAPSVQTIVVDWEGEFPSLREKHDMILVAKNGEIPLSVKTAKLLARKLMELNVSAVVDMSELDIPSRRAFVREFFDALIALPRDLWRPLLIPIDEVHMLCPERSAGEAESAQAVISMLTLGRKRGYCAVPATQRLAKLHKDCSAEANNVLIGRTAQDIDQHRAGDILGLSKADERQLRDLQPGEFYAFGPAFTQPGIFKFTVDPVTTTHPRAGERYKFVAPEASTKIRKIAEQFTDLPEQAETEIKDLAAAKAELAKYQRDAHMAQRIAFIANKRGWNGVSNPKQLDRFIEQVLTGPAATDPAATAKAIDRAKQQWLNALAKDTTKPRSQIRNAFVRLQGLIAEASQIVENAAQIDPCPLPSPSSPPVPQSPEQPKRDISRASLQTTGYMNIILKREQEPTGDVVLNKCHRNILGALFNLPNGCDIKKLLLLSGYANSGGFKNALTDLRQAGYMTGGNTEIMCITEAGKAAIPSPPPLPTGQALIDYWMRNSALNECHRRIFERLIDAHRHSTTSGLDMEGLLRLTGYAESGGFKNALTDLRQLGLIVGKNTGMMAISNEIAEHVE